MISFLSLDCLLHYYLAIVAVQTRAFLLIVESILLAGLRTFRAFRRAGGHSRRHRISSATWIFLTLAAATIISPRNLESAKGAAERLRGDIHRDAGGRENLIYGRTNSLTSANSIPSASFSNVSRLQPPVNFWVSDFLIFWQTRNQTAGT